MKILLVEPYFAGSHKDWAEELIKFSAHEIKLLSLSGNFWKWRMHGGAISLAKDFMESDFKPDLVLATDMLDLGLFISLCRGRLNGIPTALYFHENQINYPWSPNDEDPSLKRDNHYGFINYSSALCADAVYFNSNFHKEAFLSALPSFLNIFPDHKNHFTIDQIKAKSSVLPLGVDLDKIKQLKPEKTEVYNRAVILWNHRWEYDKNPKDFFDALKQLKNRGIEFKLVILGKNYKKIPTEFEEAQAYFSDEIIHFGFAESLKEYAYWLHHSDIVPITSSHDFFGVSLIQAMAMDVVPLLPKRLAYPEHIPEKFHQVYFYENQRDLVNRLQRLIMNVGVIRKQEVNHFTEKYNWPNIISQYGTSFESLLGNDKSTF